MKRILILLLRLGLAAALIAYVVSQIEFRDTLVVREGATESPEKGRIVSETHDSVTFRAEDGRVEVVPHYVKGGSHPRSAREGIVTLFRGMKLSWFSLALGMYFVLMVITVVRWRMLLHSQAIDIPFGTAFELTFIGLFFNNVVPGLTGGDVVKALYVARRVHEPTRGVISVILDRIIGLFALCLVAAVAIVFNLQKPEFQSAARVVYIVVGVSVAAGCIFFSKRLRKWLLLDRLLNLLPLKKVLQEADHAFLLYRNHKRTLLNAVLISMVSHLFGVAAYVCLGRGLGLQASVIDYYALVPVVNMILAIPLTPGAIGVSETMFMKFLALAGVPGTQAVGLSLASRVMMVFWSLLGGVFAFRERKTLSPKLAQEELHLK